MTISKLDADLLEPLPVAELEMYQVHLLPHEPVSDHVKKHSHPLIPSETRSNKNFMISSSTTFN
jgi:hypothetical protein